MSGGEVSGRLSRVWAGRRALDPRPTLRAVVDFFEGAGERRCRYVLTRWIFLRLLEGSGEVEALLEKNPFPEKPPRTIRAVLYNYRFTDSETRRREGAWWRREERGIYFPPVRLRI